MVTGPSREPLRWLIAQMDSWETPLVHKVRVIMLLVVFKGQVPCVFQENPTVPETPDRGSVKGQVLPREGNLLPIEPAPCSSELTLPIAGKRYFSIF